MLRYFFSLWEMGGYGIYIWPSYALLLAIISVFIFRAIRCNLQMQKKIRQDLWSGSDSDNQS